MRITITLDPDIATRLRRLSVERGQSMKTTVNETLRAGLDVERGKGRPDEGLARDLGVQPGMDLRRGTGHPYVEVARDLGVQPGIDLTKALDLELD